MRKDKKKRLRRISGRGEKRRARREEFYINGVFSSSRSGFGFVAVDDGDFEVFIPAQFVNDAIDGDKVKVSIRMRGRQMAHATMGVDVMNRFFEMLGGKAVMEKEPKTEGRNITMVLAPAK